VKPSLVQPTVLAALLLQAPFAAAQPRPSHPARETPKSLADSLQGPARAAYDSASLLVMNQDFAGALAKYKEAYVASEDPRLLYNMAVCEKNRRHYANMQLLLERYVSEAGARMTPEDHVAVTAALDAIRNLVATLQIAVNVDGATIAVDGEAVGRSPLERPVRIDLGKHTVTATMTGYLPAELTAEAVGGGQATMSIALVPKPHVGHLDVTTDDDASITIDAKPEAVGRFAGQLSPGVHEVSASAPGRLAYKVQVELRDGEARTLEFHLDRERAPIWPWIASGAAVVAAGVVGGYFLFKTREEQGAPPAGDLGTVFLTSLRR
jgi:hypothetical protein